MMSLGKPSCDWQLPGSFVTREAVGRFALEVLIASGVNFFFSETFVEGRTLSSLDGQPDGKAVVERFQHDQ